MPIVPRKPRRPSKRQAQRKEATGPAREQLLELLKQLNEKVAALDFPEMKEAVMEERKQGPDPKEIRAIAERLQAKRAEEQKRMAFLKGDLPEESPERFTELPSWQVPKNLYEKPTSGPETQQVSGGPKPEAIQANLQEGMISFLRERLEKTRARRSCRRSLPRRRWTLANSSPNLVA